MKIILIFEFYLIEKKWNGEFYYLTAKKYKYYLHIVINDFKLLFYRGLLE